jgi:SAM-dependent methyltransferase
VDAEPAHTDDRTKLPGARKTPGVAVGRSLLPSREEWAVRNRVLAETMAELINDHAPNVTGRALEIGCQWGLLLEAIAAQTPKHSRWWGVDPVIQRHRSRTGFELVTGLADEIPFPDKSFDVVVLANVYEHIPPPSRDPSMVEMRRVLVPGGIVVGQLPNPHFPIESHSKLPFMGYLPVRAQNAYWNVSPARKGAGFYSVTIKDLKRRADAAGLDCIVARNFTYPPEAAPQRVRGLVRRMRGPLGLVPWAWQFVLKRR